MIKILFFIPTLSGGGAEKVLCNLVNSMDQGKFDITVQTVEQCNPKMLLANGIHYKAINICKTKLGYKLFSYWFRFCAEFKLAYRFFVKEDYDIEVAYLETIATKIISQSTNKTAIKIAWVHCDLSKKQRMERIVHKLREQYHYFDKIVCVSEDVRIGFHKLLGKDFNTIVMQNVIDDSEILSKSEEYLDWFKNPDEVQLMAVGRLSPEKGYLHLIESCKKLKSENIQFHLNILGGGPEKNNLEKAIIDGGLNSSVTLRGPVTNPYPWMKKADIVVCSSQYEGLSTVVQEALILGKAIVTTPCGGMRDLLGDSEYGLIVDSSENGLHNGLYEMICSQALRTHYSQKAKERSCSFAKMTVVRNMERFFSESFNQSS